MENQYHKKEMEKTIEKTRELCKPLPDYVSRFVRSIQQRTEPKTRLEYVKDIKNFMEYIKEFLNDEGKSVEIKDISVEYLGTLDKPFFEDYFDYLQEYKKNNKVYVNSRATIKRKLSTLRKFYAFLFNNDYIKTNNITKVEIPKLHKKEIIYMNNNEVSDLLNGVKNGINNDSAMSKAYHDKQALRDTTIITLLLSTGIRVSECAGLDIKDVDLNNNCIKIIRKGGKEGTVYFSDTTTTLLSEYIAFRKTIQTDKDNEGALFLSSRRTRLGVRSIEKLVKKYAQATVPMKKISVHKLRSTYGTALYNNTNDIFVVADVLGHSDINTTSKHYSSISDTRKQEIRNEGII